MNRTKRQIGDLIKNEKVGLYGDYSYPLTFANVGKPNWSSGREIKVRRCLFTFSIQREIRHFHVVVVKKRQRNVEKKNVMHVQSCCFAY